MHRLGNQLRMSCINSGMDHLLSSPTHILKRHVVWVGNALPTLGTTRSPADVGFAEWLLAGSRRVFRWYKVVGETE